MTLVKNAKGFYEADIRDRVIGRLHLALKTKKGDIGMRRHSALEQFVREGDVALVDDLRKRRINIEAIERCVRDKRPFSELRPGNRWPILAEAVEAYLEFVAAHPKRSKETHVQATHYLKGILEFFGDNERVDRITTDRVREYMAFMQARTDTLSGNPLSAWSISLSLQRFAALYNWLIRQEEKKATEERRGMRLLHNPVDRDYITKREQTRTRFLSEDEASRLLAATPDSMRFPVLAGLMCGLRLGEVLNLRPPPQDIDLDVGLIIVQERQGWKPKTKKRREIPIAAELRPVLIHHLERYASETYVIPSSTSPDGIRPIANHTMWQRFTRVVDDAGLISGRTHPMGVTFHTLRHTFASWLIMKGIDLLAVSKLLGHSSVDQVVQTYGHLSPDHKSRAVAQLGAWLSTVHLEEDVS